MLIPLVDLLLVELDICVGLEFGPLLLDVALGALGSVLRTNLGLVRPALFALLGPLNS
jgi:hypothetical protein